MRNQDILDETFESEWEAAWDSYEEQQDLKEYISNNYAQYSRQYSDVDLHEGWEY